MRTPKPFYRRFNDTWYVQIGKKQVRLAKGQANEAEAYRRYFVVMAEHPTGGMADPLPDLKVAFVCDLFLEWCKRHNAPRTYQWYRDFLQDFCDRCGKMALSELKPFHVTRWLDANPDWNGSRRGAISAVKRAFNWAVEQGRLTANPIKGVKKPPPRARERFLTLEERRKIFANYPDGDARAGQFVGDEDAQRVVEGDVAVVVDVQGAVGGAEEAGVEAEGDGGGRTVVVGGQSLLPLT